MKHKFLFEIIFPVMLISILLSCQRGDSEQSASPDWEFEALPAEVKNNFFANSRGANVLVDDGYWIWGLTVLKGDDGKYHGYYARWPDSLEFSAWLTHCEIAHGVADNPEGPFEFQSVVLESRNLDGWDVNNAHNPSVCVAEGQICLYYISNDIREKYQGDIEEDYPDMAWFRENRRLVRNSQRINVAIAEDPAGPFDRADQPVVEPHGNFKNIAVNPAVVYVDGQYVMIMKGDDVRHEEVHRIQFVGHADNPEGPFTFQDEPVYAEAQTEDAALWYDQQRERFFMTVHVMWQPELALFTSEDSYNWQMAENPVFMKKEIQLDDGSVWTPDRLERPFVLTDDQGNPEMLYVAVSDSGVTGNIAIPVK